MESPPVAKFPQLNSKLTDDIHKANAAQTVKKVCDSGSHIIQNTKVYCVTEPAPHLLQATMFLRIHNLYQTWCQRHNRKEELFAHFEDG